MGTKKGGEKRNVRKKGEREGKVPFWLNRWEGKEKKAPENWKEKKNRFGIVRVKGGGEKGTQDPSKRKRGGAPF